MNKRIKAKWLKALRSGKYRQGREVLRYVDTESATYLHCCLGVLADCTGMRWRQIYVDPFTEAKAPLHQCALIPNRAAERRFGLKPGEQRILASYNDTEEWTFEQIADWIQANL